MNFKDINDEALLAALKQLVRRERELLTIVLHHLREIERRRLFYGYSSLFEYAVHVLGYSAGQAYRRIAAMRAIEDTPELEAKIKSGELNLTHVGLAHSLFNAETKAGRPVTTETKTAIFDALIGTTTRQAERVIQSFATTTIPHRDRIRPIGDGRNSVTIEISDKTLAKLDKLKGLFAHKYPQLTYGELIEKLADQGLDLLDPTRTPPKRPNSNAEIRRQIWRRDGGACVNCGSTYAVEEDHILPAAMGGPYTLENMRLLCRSCNQRAAIEVFGQKKMDPYLTPDRKRVRKAGVSYAVPQPGGRIVRPEGPGYGYGCVNRPCHQGRPKPTTS